jgi:glutathione S-transferase
MSLIFYYAPMSSATPVHWSLEELGVPYEKVKLDVRAGDAKKADFLKINPNGQVPALVHDGAAIFESVAIQIYLGETFGEAKGLFPAAGPKRGEALAWLVWCNVTLGDAVNRVFYNTSDRVPAELRNAAAGAVAREHVDARLRVLDAALEGRAYLTGESFSLADAHLISWMDYLSYGQIDVKAHRNVVAWAERGRARPAYARVMAAGG